MEYLNILNQKKRTYVPHLQTTSGHTYALRRTLSPSGLWGNWLWLTGPRSARFGETIPEQEQGRRAQLLSALLLLIIVAVVLSIPNALKTPMLWWPLLTISGLGMLSALLNRASWTTAAAITYLLAINLTIIILIGTQPHGIANNNLPDFDLFCLSVLIGGLTISRGYIPFIGLCNCGLIVLLFLCLSHDPLLTQEIRTHQGGLVYTSLTDALLLQICAVTIAWVGAWSVTRALRRANRAEELVQARTQISEQARLLAARNQRLEEGIAQLLETHRQIAAGNFSVRAPMQEDHELWQLSRSLNTLLGRLQQQARASQELAATRRDIEHLAEALKAARAGEPLRYPRSSSPLGLLLLKALRL